MLETLLGVDLYNIIVNTLKKEDITEVRLRIGRKIAVKNASNRFIINETISQAHIDYILKIATRNSLYAYEDEIKQGFLTFNGIRIGLSGEGVTASDKLLTIKNVTSLNLRIPHEVLGIADKIPITNDFQNTIIISPPYGGKTTLIRDFVRILSKKYEVLLIDERGEIFAKNFSFGDFLDVFQYTQKNLIVENVIRSLSPEIIVVDEIFPAIDLQYLNEIVRSGIKILASIHSDDFETIKSKYPELTSLFKYAIVLSNKPKVGVIKSLIRL